MGARLEYALCTDDHTVSLLSENLVIHLVRGLIVLRPCPIALRCRFRCQNVAKNGENNRHPGVNDGLNCMVSDWSFLMTSNWMDHGGLNVFWSNQKFCIIFDVLIF